MQENWIYFLSKKIRNYCLSVNPNFIVIEDVIEIPVNYLIKSFKLSDKIKGWPTILKTNHNDIIELLHNFQKSTAILYHKNQNRTNQLKIKIENIGRSKKGAQKTSLFPLFFASNFHKVINLSMENFMKKIRQKRE